MKNIIYQIRSIKTGNLYIGSTIDYRKRKSEHKKSLKDNNHHSKYLQRAYNKYGEENFKFEILEHVDNPENLIEREQHWINKYDFEELYNCCKIAGSTLGYNHTKESKKKMSHAWKTRVISEETKRKMSAAKKGNPSPMEGKKHTEETKKKISKKSSGHNNGFYNKEHPTRKPILQIDINTNDIVAIFACVKDAALYMNGSPGTLSAVCNKIPIYNKKYNKTTIPQTYKGYKWKFA